MAREVKGYEYTVIKAVPLRLGSPFTLQPGTRVIIDKLIQLKSLQQLASVVHPARGIVPLKSWDEKEVFLAKKSAHQPPVVEVSLDSAANIQVPNGPDSSIPREKPKPYQDDILTLDDESKDDDVLALESDADSENSDDDEMELIFTDKGSVGMTKSEADAYKRKQVMRSKLGKPKGPWLCEWCEYTNKKEHSKCKACHHLWNDDAEEAKLLDEGEWRCEHCGVINLKINQIYCICCGVLNDDPDPKHYPDNLQDNPLGILDEAMRCGVYESHISLGKHDIFRILKLFDKNLTPKQVQSVFRSLDADQSGDVSLTEFFTGMIKIAQDPNGQMHHVMKDMFDDIFKGHEADKIEAKKELGDEYSDSDSTSDSDFQSGKAAVGLINDFWNDENNDGQMHWDEFSKTFKEYNVTEELFNELDDDGSGYLDIKEFSDVLIMLAARDPEKFGKAAERIFLRGLNQISLQRRVRMVHQSKALTEAFTKATQTDASQWTQSRQDDITCKHQRKIAKHECRTWIKQHQGKFQDAAFRGNWASIMDCWIAGDEKDSEFGVSAKKEYKSDHIKQGKLGDCYFLTSLSLMAQRPGLIQRLVVTPHQNDSGIYKIRFCHDGRWKVITIDDKLPFIKHHTGVNLVKNAQPVVDNKVKVMWVPLLEKAWSKLHGSYETIEAGLVRETLFDLTGAPTASWCTRKESFDQELMFHRIIGFFKLGYLMGAATDEGLGDNVFKSVGLVEGHAYALLCAEEVKGQRNSRGQPLRLVKLRNPWGRGEWSGSYADGDAAMTQELASRLNHKIDKEDGTFWMEWEKFIDYFRDITVCKVVHNWQSVEVVGTFPTRSTLPKEALMVYIDRPTHTYISINQPDKRTESNRNKAHTDIGLIVLQVNRKNYHKVECWKFKEIIWSDITRNNTCEVTFLDAEKAYMLLPYSFKDHGFDTEFTTKLYSPNVVTVRKIKPQMKFLRVGLHLAFEDARPESIMQCRPLEGGKVEYMTVQAGGCIYIVIINKSKDQYYYFMTDYSNSQGLESERGVMKSTDYIPPNHRQIIATVVKTSTKGYGWGLGQAGELRRKILGNDVQNDPKVSPNGIFLPVKNKKMYDIADGTRLPAN